MTLQIIQLVVYKTDSAQPFSATSSSNDLLNELSTARRSDPLLATGGGGITHLLTGRGIGGSNGVAWVAGVCDGFYGAGLSVIDSRPGYRESILVAHEIGHNLGASHDGPDGTGCEATTFGFVMWPRLDSGITDQFSDCSEARIARQVSFAPCLAGTIAATCGNGIVDEGEACDGAGTENSCCRADCTFDVAGLPCGESDNVCMDNVCDGAGSCLAVPNEDPCMADDACAEGRCSGGTCEAGDTAREFSDVRAKFRVDDLGMIGTAKLSATTPLLMMGSDPCGAGVEFVATIGDIAAWDEFIPGDRWVRKGASTFVYKAGVTTAGSIHSAKIAFNAATGRASYRFKLAPPMGPVRPAPPSVFVLAGNRSDGQCAAGPLIECSQRGGSYSCQ